MNELFLRSEGFAGFKTFEELDLGEVPREPGIYAVLHPEGRQRAFLEESVGGWFKRKNPTILLDALAAEWVDGADVLYVGKAGAGTSSARGLRKRIQEFMDFGRGRPVGHWGGRLIWQLADSQSLLIAWKVLPAAEVNEAEAKYHAEFRCHYGRLPFANLVQARSAGV
ncbi:hypothetical protein [Pseudarthrobacter sp. 1C304]|uniref:hypothetical protein n=1 Tax=Pseudarthrobacter sp. 1C304 TaxID=3457438 RepID=UPI003FD5A73A